MRQGDGDMDILVLVNHLAGSQSPTVTVSVSLGGGPKYTNELYRYDHLTDDFSLVMDSGLTNVTCFATDAVFGDMDGDGDLDVFITTGTPDGDGQITVYPAKNQLYRNEGGGQFSLVADSAAVVPSNNAWSASWGDLDGDGDL